MTRLLIITQAVDKNNPVLGFFHGWIEEFSKHYEKISVVTLYEGEHNLPSNVRVYSLGKDKGSSRLKYLINFYKYIFSLRGDYDKVFVHMNQEYVLLGGLLWRVWRKKIALWYVHRQRNIGLWLSEKIANRIFTSVPDSFRVESQKVKYFGHGIDISQFSCAPKHIGQEVRLLHVGRITRIKNLDVAVRASLLLRKELSDKTILLNFIGSPVTEDDNSYLRELKSLLEDNGLNPKTVFVGVVQNSRINKEYCKADITLNLTPTGGLDKSVLESLASNRPVFFSNEAYKTVLGTDSVKFYFPFRNHVALAEKVKSHINQPEDDTISKLANMVRKEYSVVSLIGKIVSELNETASK